MQYPIQFEKLINDLSDKSLPYENNREPNPYFIGFGNPFAKILVIGKEKGFNVEDEDQLIRESTFNLRQWEAKMNENKPNLNLGQFENQPFDPEHPYGKGYSKDTSDTWRNYQKLCNEIYPKGSFKEHFFMTELNYLPSKKSDGIKKVRKNVTDRLNEVFRKEYFQQRFEVILLACNNYIRPQEIYDVFQCKYDGDERGKHSFGRGSWYYTHKNNYNRILVIHTRQLSNSFNRELIPSLGKVIKEHVNYNPF